MQRATFTESGGKGVGGHSPNKLGGLWPRIFMSSFFSPKSVTQDTMSPHSTFMSFSRAVEESSISTELNQDILQVKSLSL